MNSKNIDQLLEQNRDWAFSVENARPGFFTRLLQQQNPKYLWIGCSDSRVPANEIVGLDSGELFVHRNIANVVVHSDLNCLSVMQFALEQLRVKHIMVVGHNRCSGVRAALLGMRIGLADNWLRHVRDVCDKHQAFLDTIIDEGKQHNALCELNVLEQAMNVCQATVVQDAWMREQELTIHGWVYALHNGLIQDLRFAVTGPQHISDVYEKALASLHRRYAFEGA